MDAFCCAVVQSCFLMAPPGVWTLVLSWLIDLYSIATHSSTRVSSCTVINVFGDNAAESEVATRSNGE